MNVKVLESVGVVGKEIGLSFQELVAIKDKWQSIFDKDAELSVYENQKEMLKVSLTSIKEMDILIAKIVGDIPSTSEVHNDLFTKADVYDNIYATP